MNRNTISIVFLSFVCLSFIVTSAFLPVFSLKNNPIITSYGTVNYLTSGFPKLYVDGKYLKGPSGNEVILRGVVLDSGVWWTSAECYSEQQILYMKNWGSNAIRLNLQAYSLEQITSEGVITNSDFLGRLDNLISWATNQNLYVILNFHPAGSCSHGNLRVEIDHYMPTHWGGNDWAFWLAFWNQLSARYSGYSNVMYEILSEPIDANYAIYQSRNRECIDTIRTNDDDAIVIIQAVDSTGAYDCKFEFEQSHPISRSNIVYTFHRYGYHHTDNSESSIRNYLSYIKADWMLANGRCVLATEFGGGGPWHEGGAMNDPWSVWQATWVKNFMTVMDEDGYSGYIVNRWTDAAWTCGEILADWNGNPSPYGNVIKTYYLAKQGI